MIEVHRIDIIILIAYLIILILIGLWSGRRKSESTAVEFFLTSKTLPWYAIGFSILAAGISSEQFLGTVGFAYQYGLSVANWEWLNIPAILLLVFIFVPIYHRWKIITMPQFLEIRYSPKVRTIFAVITLLTYVFINMAGVIFSGGFALQLILGIDLYLGIWLLTILAGFFVIYGGMESVAWTNVFQSALLLSGGLLVFFLGWLKVPGGFEAIIGAGDRSHLILPMDHPEIPATGLIVLAISTNVWFFCTNQTINQAALGAKNIRHARHGVLFAGFLGILIAFADVFPGLIAFALNPNLPFDDDAFPYVVGELVPAGLRGLVFAGLLGAIVSTLEALGNATATIFTFDIYQRMVKKEVSERLLIRSGRIAAVIAMLIGALWAPIVLQFGHIFSYFQECWAFIAIPVAVIFVLGVFLKNLTNQAALWTLCLSFPMLILPYLLRIFNVQWNVFNVAGIVLIFTILFALITSYLTKKTVNENSTNALWDKSLDKISESDQPFYRKTVFWAVVITAIYAFIYISLW